MCIRDRSKSFGRNRVLDHINLDVRKGTVMGLMGENGAGKSTMMKCLFGTYQKDEGTIYLDGKEVSFSGPKDALENGIAMVHQELNQCLERNVVDNPVSYTHLDVYKRQDLQRKRQRKLSYRIS